MAKRQRSLVLDENVAQMIDAFQDGTGATFTRIVTAALLQYFFDDPSGPNAKWMGFVRALERGDIALSGIPMRAAADAADMSQQIKHALDKAKPGNERLEELLGRVANLDLNDYKRQWWEHILAQDASPADALLLWLRGRSPRGGPPI